MKYWIAIIIMLAVFTITFFVWNGVLNQALIGEGAIYFVEPYLSMVESEGLIGLWSRHDVQALLFFRYLRDLIGTNTQLYMWFLLIGTSAVGWVVFWLVKKYTDSYLFAFFSVIMVIVNFGGSFEIIGIGYYQWFIQRVPNFALALLGFKFLVSFYKNNKTRDYFLSLIIYLASVFLARYTIHALPLFVLFILLNKARFAKKLILASPFVLGSYLLMSAQTLVDGNTFTSFLLNVEVIPKVFRQVTFLSIMPFLSIFPNYVLGGLIEIFAIPTLLAYFVFAGIAVKKSKKLFAIVVTLVLSIYGSVYLSIYLNPYFADFYDTSRYLYYTSILVAIFWGIVLNAIFTDRPVYKSAMIIFIAAWFLYNNKLISKNIYDWQERHDPVTTTMKYVLENQDKIKNGTYVMIPEGFSHYATGMMNYLYRDKNYIFFTKLDEDIKPEKYTLISYDKTSRRLSVREISR